MPELSRRNLIAAAAAAQLAFDGVRGGPLTAMPTVRPRPTKTDPVVGKVEAWMASRDAIDAMIEEWAHLEVALCAKKPAGMSLTQASRSRLPEARAMRELDRKIKPGLRRLHRQARSVALMRATSAEGALAKVRLGARIQGPYDWNDDCVFALIQDGCEQLALFLNR